MKLFSRIKITSIALLLGLSAQVGGAWNKVDHPFDGMLMYHGPETERIEWDGYSRLGFWVMLRLYEDGEKQQSLHHVIVDCSDNSYIQAYLKSDFVVVKKGEKEKPWDFSVKYPTTMDMMYYPIVAKCEKELDLAGGVCYAEDLERTNKEELSDMLTNELSDDGN